MKNMRGRVLRKLKSISNPTWNPGLVFQPNTSLQAFQALNPVEKHKNHNPPIRTGQSLVFYETPMDTKEEKTTPSLNADTEEKLEDVLMHERIKSTADYDLSSNSGTSTCRTTIAETERPSDDKDQEKLPLISNFEDKCPPGGKDVLVLYTTSLRGIRKTFEDCNTIRFLLESFHVLYSERDVSMHLEYRDELWGVLGGRVVPPRLFIRGRYIGGADEVVGLHEKGMLKNLLKGIPLSLSNCPCRGCGGVRFVLCFGCNGSRKVVDNSGVSMRCCDCNENGLVKCSVCS